MRIGSRSYNPVLVLLLTLAIALCIGSRGGAQIADYYNNRCPIVIEGQIVEATPRYQLVSSNMIERHYQTYFIKVLTVFKGELKSEWIEVPREILDHHNLGVSKEGGIGILCLSENISPALFDSLDLKPRLDRQYQLMSFRGHMFRYDRLADIDSPPAYYANIENGLLKEMEETIGRDRRRIDRPLHLDTSVVNELKSRGLDNQSAAMIMNLNAFSPTEENNYWLTLYLNVRSANRYPQDLKSVDLQFRYDTTAYGASLAANDNIRIITKPDDEMIWNEGWGYYYPMHLYDKGIYKATVEDMTPNRFALNIEAQDTSSAILQIYENTLAILQIRCKDPEKTKGLYFADGKSSAVHYDYFENRPMEVYIMVRREE